MAKSVSSISLLNYFTKSNYYQNWEVYKQLKKPQYLKTQLVTEYSNIYRYSPMHYSGLTNVMDSLQAMRGNLGKISLQVDILLCNYDRGKDLI